MTQSSIRACVSVYCLGSDEGRNLIIAGGVPSMKDAQRCSCQGTQLKIPQINGADKKPALRRKSGTLVKAMILKKGAGELSYLPICQSVCLVTTTGPIR